MLCWAIALVSGTAIMAQSFDRAAEDLGNSIHLEHVNVRIPDQRLAMLFYSAGLGLTRDPIMMPGDDQAGRAAQHLGIAGRQVELAAPDVDPHVAVAGHQDRKSTRLNSSHIPLSRMP